MQKKVTGAFDVFIMWQCHSLKHSQIKCGVRPENYKTLKERTFIIQSC